MMNRRSTCMRCGEPLGSINEFKMVVGLPPVEPGGKHRAGPVCIPCLYAARFGHDRPWMEEMHHPEGEDFDRLAEAHGMDERGEAEIRCAGAFSAAAAKKGSLLLAIRPEPRSLSDSPFWAGFAEVASIEEEGLYYHRRDSLEILVDVPADAAPLLLPEQARAHGLAWAPSDGIWLLGFTREHMRIYAAMVARQSIIEGWRRMPAYGLAHDPGLLDELLELSEDTLALLEELEAKGGGTCQG